MTPEEYAAQQALISATVARYVAQFGKFFRNQALDPRTWIQLLQLLFPEVLRQRTASAELARRFYDSERFKHHPELPRHDRFVENYDIQQFAKEMEPARKQMSREDAPEHAVAQLALRATRAVENGGRRQIIRAVEDDTQTPVRGWARVATGNETCAFCLMLISRGPVYQAASTAGLAADDTPAERMVSNGEDLSELMEEWHPGCDCKVVPVYDKQNWPGKAAADAALELWNEASRAVYEARTAEVGEEAPVKRKIAGPDRGKPLTLNEEVINALRRRLDSGDIQMTEFAGLRAA